ncbi:MAG: hypothetical protein IRY85_01945 [Micromonosporaceae bacterium]|nr:hypothetical protein [Micromonosporaceae bacterium]
MTLVMRRVYVGIVGLLLVSAVLQFYFAAVGAFARPQTDDSFSLHLMNGRMIFPLLALLSIGAAALAKAPGRLIGLTSVPLGLVILQSVIVTVGHAVGGATEQRTTPLALAILGLHAINGMILMGATSTVLRRARALLSSTTAPAPAPVSAR